ncbi:hypothetical protein BASA60_009738 [Batrachochytrium salamandrivorans]|nr:hypothetical protein BASA60_009738 [Batrachochytrium salamandrivorans]
MLRHSQSAVQAALRLSADCFPYRGISLAATAVVIHTPHMTIYSGGSSTTTDPKNPCLLSGPLHCTHPTTSSIPVDECKTIHTSTTSNTDMAASSLVGKDHRKQVRSRKSLTPATLIAEIEKYGHWTSNSPIVLAMFRTLNSASPEDIQQALSLSHYVRLLSMAAHGAYKTKSNSYYTSVSLLHRLTLTTTIFESMMGSAAAMDLISDNNTGPQIPSPDLQDAYTYMIELHARCGDPRSSKELLTQMIQYGLDDSTVPILSHMVFGHTLAEQPAQAEPYVARLREATGLDSPRAHTILIKAHTQRNDLKSAIQTYTDMESNGIIPDTFILGSLCNLYFRLGDIISLEKTVKEFARYNLPIHTRVYNLRLQASNSMCDYSWTIQLLRRMRDQGVSFNTVTHIERFVALAGRRDWERLWPAYDIFIKNKTITVRVLVAMCKAIRPLKTLDQIDRIMQQCTKFNIDQPLLLSSLMSGFADMGDVKSVVTLAQFAHKKEIGLELVQLSHVKILRAYCQAKDLQGALKHLWHCVQNSKDLKLP